MSLKRKLKRAFLKAHKFLIVSVVILVIISSSCIVASADSKNEVVEIAFFRSSVKYLTSGGVSSSEWVGDTVELVSPYGGIFYGAKRNDSINNVESVGMLFQLDSSSYVKINNETEYTLSGYFAMPWDNKLVTDDIYLNLQTFEMGLREDGESVVHFFLNDALNISKWEKKLVHHNDNVAYFGFYHFEFKFIPTQNFSFERIATFWKYNLASLPNSGGFFGFSDLTLSFEYNPLTEPNYSSPDGSAINEHNDLANNIENETQAGLNQAVDSMTFDTNNNYFVSMIDGVLLFKDILDLAFTKLPFYNVLLEFSLALGLFAFLLGLSIYAVGKIGKSGGSGKGNRKGGGG